MTRVLAIAPQGGNGLHVFRPEARDFLATFGVEGIGRRVWVPGARPNARRLVQQGDRYVWSRGGWADGPPLGAWLRQPPSELFLFDQNLPKPRRRATVIEWLRAQNGPVDALELCMHGGVRWLQTGHDLETLDELADELARILSPHACVFLAACWTGGPRAKDGWRNDAPGGDGGIADVLRDMLVARGLVWIRILAHSTRGHATRNWLLRAMVGGGDRLAGTGGYYVVAPSSPRRRRWQRYLTVEGPAAPRHRMVTLTDEEIHAELEAHPELAA
ncbi:MAG: hypothetical protein IT379_39335 [Deltaproteobacteria bacterium]|nr:hypothetical protein [Deltaproteobacteria bacterium]